MKIKLTSIALLSALLLPSCATPPNPENQITIRRAVEQSVDALEYAYSAKTLNHGSWGLKPAEVTLTFNVSNQKNINHELTLAASTPATTSLLASLGGKFSKSETTQQGNVITIKFTQGGR